MSAPLCTVCLDTGSKSQWIDGELDCHACSAADERVALRKQMGQRGYPDQDCATWRAYQLGKAAAAPVVPVAAQPVVPEGWKLVPEEPTAAMFDAACKIDNDMFAGGRSHGADNGQVWAAMYGAAPAAPQPAASVTDVAKDAERYKFLCRAAFDASMAQEEIDKEVDAAIAAQQGEKT